MIKLLNKGQRSITVHKGLDLHPGEVGQFTPDVGAKLQRLYAGEVVSLEDEVKRFDKPADVKQSSKQTTKSKEEEISTDDEKDAALDSSVEAEMKRVNEAQKKSAVSATTKAAAKAAK